MIQEVIQSYFNKDADEVIYIPTGITNRNYRVTVDNENYVIRIPYPDSDHIVDRNNEAVILDLIKQHQLDAPLEYYDPTSGIKITRYIEHVQHFDEVDDPNKYKRVALMMRKLHDLQIESGVFFDPIEKLSEYASHIKTPLYDVTFATSVSEKIRLYQGKKILCHNDWVNGNMLFTPSRMYLIDYEYAGDNHPLFDVMSFLTENNITDTQKRNQFYLSYFGYVPEGKLKEDLDLFEAFSNLLWCTWAMMMYEQRNEDIFHTIATMKYEALCHNIKQTG